MVRAACTIASYNYLPYARTLCNSFLAIHPDYRFYVLLVDTLPADFDPADDSFDLVLVQDLEIPNFNAVAFKYGILELNTNVKPTFLKNLLDRGIEQLLYFDPDILICSSTAPIYSALDMNSIVLTPHCISTNENNP